MSETTHKTVHWRRAIRPLIWWSVLVLAMLGYRTHERLSAKTQVSFEPVFIDNGPAYELSCTMDGRPFRSGQHASIGRHSVSILHPKAKAYITNLFVWYGANDLGRIPLERAHGTIVVSARPPAQRLEIRGPEFSVMLTNSTGITSAVPTDIYLVEATYQYWNQYDRVTVEADQSAVQNYAPKLGALHLEASHSNVGYRLLGKDSRLVAAGTMPNTITELPEGEYQLILIRNLDRRESKVLIKAGLTNQNRVEFTYGTALFESDPSGASVESDDGRSLGQTPLTLKEIATGNCVFKLHLDGHEPVTASLLIIANQSVTFRTNLVSQKYLALMRNAQQALASQDYSPALLALNEALAVQPGDAAALALLPKADGNLRIKTAKEKRRQDNISGAIQELSAALQVLPDNQEARLLMDEFKKAELDQQARAKQKELELEAQRRQEILARPKATFDELTQKWRADAGPYKALELQVKLDVQEVERRIRIAFINEQPTFIATPYDSKFPNAFALGVYQQLPGGARRCLIGGSQIGEETKFYYIVIEYSGAGKLGFNASSIALNPTFVNLSEQQKIQIAEGLRLTSDRIRNALKLLGDGKP